MSRKGEEARRKKGIADTEVWRRELEQVGIVFGAHIELQIPILNMAQLHRVAGVLRDLAGQIEIIHGARNLKERSQVFGVVHSIRRANARIRHTPRGSRPR